MRKTAVGVLILSIILSVSGGHIAYAEIEEPYVLDEKDQVIFGDSGSAIDGHKGLENYTTEYVGGYLHVTYTYSHFQGFFASFPPIAYITAQDPRTTATPTVRSQEQVSPIASGDPTDWYSYDIQFDATGYTVTVLKTGVTAFDSEDVVVAGLTDTDWMALANESPKATPPTSASMAFTPLLIHEEESESSDPESEEIAASSRGGERGRCVETNIGLYCQNEKIREFHIRHNMEMLIGALERLIALYQEEL